MGMTVLSEVSRWLLDEPALRVRWGQEFWHGAFEACGSHQEWADFVAAQKGHPALAELLDQYHKASERARTFGIRAPHSPVVLPNF